MGVWRQGWGKAGGESLEREVADPRGVIGKIQHVAKATREGFQDQESPGSGGLRASRAHLTANIRLCPRWPHPLPCEAPTGKERRDPRRPASTWPKGGRWPDSGRGAEVSDEISLQTPGARG